MIEFTSDITVELTGHYGTDADICHAARVSTTEERNEELTYEKQRGLIRALMRDKHGSPFEAGYFEFFIDGPRGIRDENVRHRAGWSYSSSSLRFRKGAPRVYIPGPNRPLRKAEGFKQIRPLYEALPREAYERYVEILKQGYEASYEAMALLDSEGFIETECSRWLTHDGRMTPYIARCNPRGLMHFLSLRTHEDTANHPSFPMWEIEYVARQMEQSFASCLPFTYDAFNSLGREAP